MLKILVFLVFIAALFVGVSWLLSHFSGENRALRAARKGEAGTLTAERTRSNLAQKALREIAAGAEYPIFVAGNALDSIEKTYTNKEINQ